MMTGRDRRVARNVILAGAIGLVTGTVFATQISAPLGAQENSEAEVYRQLDLFGDIFERVRSQYVEEVDEAELIEAAIDGMLASLDPHSGYLPAEAFEDMQVQTRGEFGGLGIEVTMEEGFVKVVSPIDDTPAAAAGMQANDLITHVDGDTVLGLTLREAVELMRGPVGSEITITVLRDGVAEPFDVTIIRDIIQITAVRTRVEGDAVVVRITTFNDQTYDNLEAGIAEAVAEAGGPDAVSGFVIDLRNNPGGLLSQAIMVSDAFLDAGEIVSTRGRDTRDSERYNAEAGDLTDGKPIVVLINGGSASASEIVAGALQDHRRAVLVGTKSFGKGSVQTIMPLTQDSAIRLTTSRYYTPSGRSIQALGVAPDILVPQQPRAEDDAEDDAPPLLLQGEEDLRGRLDNDSLTDDERIQLEEDARLAREAAERRAEDYQLAYALDLLRGLAKLDDRD
jgi:carboxyl-terminal processing protease